MKFILIFLFSCYVSLNAVEFDNRDDFIDFVKTNIQEVNENILNERKILLDNNNQEQELVNDILKKYSIEDIDNTVEIEKKVQVIPEEIAIIQAIVESNFGKSRSARVANNLFGMRTFSKDTPSIKPLNKNVKHKIRAFTDYKECIELYAKLLNTSSFYKHFREIRHKHPNDVMKITEGLINYSEEGEKYISMLKQKIRLFFPVKKNS